MTNPKAHPGTIRDIEALAGLPSPPSAGAIEAAKAFARSAGARPKPVVSANKDAAGDIGITLDYPDQSVTICLDGNAMMVFDNDDWPRDTTGWMLIV